MWENPLFNKESYWTTKMPTNFTKKKRFYEQIQRFHTCVSHLAAFPCRSRPDNEVRWPTSRSCGGREHLTINFLIFSPKILTTHLHFWVGSYLLLNTIFHWLYSVVLPIVFCAKSIVIFVRSIVPLASPETLSMRYDTNPHFCGKVGTHFPGRMLIKMIIYA